MNEEFKPTQWRILFWAQAGWFLGRSAAVMLILITLISLRIAVQAEAVITELHARNQKISVRLNVARNQISMLDFWLRGWEEKRIGNITLTYILDRNRQEYADILCNLDAILYPKPEPFFWMLEGAGWDADAPYRPMKPANTPR